MVSKQQSSTVTLNNGAEVAIRPLTAADVDLERDFIMGLSPQARRFRFLDTIAAPSGQLLKQLTTLDAKTEAAFVALVTDEGEEREIGVARMSATGEGRAEFAVAVNDKWLRQGLGTVLTNLVIEEARARSIQTLYSVDSAENTAMRHFCCHLGFEHVLNPDDSTEVLHTLKLSHRQGPAMQKLKPVVGGLSA